MASGSDYANNDFLLKSGVVNGHKPTYASDDSMKAPFADMPTEEQKLGKAIRLNQRSHQTNAHRSPKAAGPTSQAAISP